MPYLRYRDYITKIEDVNLAAIIRGDDSLRLLTETQAQEEVENIISMKYDVATEFTDTTVWSPSKVYLGFALVELNYPAFDATKVYAVNDLFTFTDGFCYITIVLTTAGQTPITNPTKFTNIGTKYDLFNVVPTFPLFNYKSYYKIGDKVFWKNKIYTALLNSPLIDHQTALQYGQISNIPYPNVFPDDPIDGATYWGTGIAFNVPAGTLPTNAAWTKGDNRSQMLVQKCVDICLYHLHAAIPPRNIPQIRMDRYAAAIAYLDMIKDGERSAKIPLLQPKTDGKIRYGGQVKRQNDY